MAKHLVQSLCSHLQRTEFDLFSLHYSVDGNAPCLGTQRFALVAVDRLRGAVVVEPHRRYEPLDITWQRAALMRDELREWTPVASFPIRALVVSGAISRALEPCDAFLGVQDFSRLACTLRELLDVADSTPHPRFVDALRANYIVVEEVRSKARKAA